MQKKATGNTSDHQRPTKRPGRWLRRLIILLGIVCVLLGGVMYFTRPARLNRVLVQLLETSIGCKAQVGQAHLTWDGLLTVDGIELTVPESGGEMARLMSTDRMAVKLRLLPLLIGRIRAESVALNAPVVYLTEDLDNGRFNYEMLLSQTTGQHEDVDLPDVLPELHLNGGELCFGQVVDGHYKQIETIMLDGKLNADTSRSGVYEFALAQRHAPTKLNAPLIQGEVDLNEPYVELEVKGFAFDGPYRYLLPSEVRSWWDHLRPTGAIPSAVFIAHPDENGYAAVLAQMDLDGIGLSLSWVKGHRLQVADVTGSVTLTSNDVSFEKVTGRIEGIEMTTGGRIEGYTKDAGWELAIETKPFDIPAEGGIWDCLPPSVTKYRERFSPHGTYQAAFSIKRAASDADLEMHGYVDLIDTQFMYHRFQYPARKLTGRISFHGDRIVLNDLIGITPSGAQGIVSGTIGPPLKDGAVSIRIHGEDLPLDEHLVNAMSEKRRKVLDIFFSQEGYESLLAQGVIRAPGESGVDHPGDETDGPIAAANDAVSIDHDVPEFEPGGLATMTVTIFRPAGKDQKYQVTTDLQTTGLSSVFDFWRYPLVCEGGRVVITPDDVEVFDVRMRALNGGGGVVSGHLELPRDGSKLEPNLQLTSIRLPVDDLLIASIPEPQNQWVRPLHITGELVGTGEVYADSTDQVRFTVDALFQHGRAAPNGGSYPIENIEGAITIERKRVQMENFSGRHGEGSITLNGQADYGESGFGIDLTFLGDDLPIERGIIDLVPAEHEARTLISELFDIYQPEGLTDARLTYQGGRDGTETFNLEVQPESLNFDYKSQRIELTELQGTIALTPSIATLHHVSGRYPAGTFSIDGEARLGEDNGLALTFDAQADRIDATARAIMPQAVRTLVDRLSIQGPFVLDDVTLFTWPTVQEGPSAIFEGKIGLRDGKAQLGIALTEINANLDARVVTFSHQPWPHIDITMHAEKLRAADRLVQHAYMHVQTGDESSTIHFDDLKGTVYGGALVGRGQATLAPPGLLGFELTLQEAELEPFLKPLGEKASRYDAAVTEPDAVSDMPTRDMSSGLLSAGLSIRVPIDGSDAPQGRGIVTVRDATLYDKPLTLALLQAANLSLPNESSFDRASARYLINGSTVFFDDIRFEAPAFIIAGNGTMAYPSTDLNLRMVTSNPVAPDLGPISKLVKTFKNELLAIEVKGTLAKPQAGMVPLEGVFRSWGRIFGDTRAGAQAVEVDLPEE